MGEVIFASMASCLSLCDVRFGNDLTYKGNRGFKIRIVWGPEKDCFISTICYFKRLKPKGPALENYCHPYNASVTMVHLRHENAHNRSPCAMHHCTWIPIEQNYKTSASRSRRQRTMVKESFYNETQKHTVTMRKTQTHVLLSHAGFSGKTTSLHCARVGFAQTQRPAAHTHTRLALAVSIACVEIFSTQI